VVEQWPFKPKVVGSIPTAPTRFSLDAPTVGGANGPKPKSKRQETSRVPQFCPQFSDKIRCPRKTIEKSILGALGFSHNRRKGGAVENLARGLKTETVRCRLPVAREVKTEIPTQYIVGAVSGLLAMSFAAVWGAHLYQTTVLFPAWFSELPKSLVEWLATPYSKRVPGFYRWAVSVLYTFATIAVVVAVVTGLRMRLSLAVAGVCGLIHLALNLLIFLPTNLKLGLDPGGPGVSSLDPQMVKMLARRWRRWNFVRLGVETAGLIAALFAVKAS
jgi:hypothetical protein